MRQETSESGYAVPYQRSGDSLTHSAVSSTLTAERPLSQYPSPQPNRVRINRRLSYAFQGFQDRVGDALIAHATRVKRLDIPAVFEQIDNGTYKEPKGVWRRLGERLASPFSQLSQYTDKKAPWIKRVGEALFFSPVRTGEKVIHWIKKRTIDQPDKELREHPNLHRQALQREVKFGFLNAVGREWPTKSLITVKNIVQGGGLVLDHLFFITYNQFTGFINTVAKVAGLPLHLGNLPNIPINLPLLSTLFPHMFGHGIPIYFSSMVIASLFNIPNAIHALSEKRYKKAGYEALLLTPLAVLIPIGLITNSFWQERVLRPLEFRRNRQLMNYIHQTIVHPKNGNQVEARKAFESILIPLMRRRFGKNDTYSRALVALDQEEKDLQRSLARREKGLRNLEKGIAFLKQIDNVGQHEATSWRAIVKIIPFLATLLPKVFLHAGHLISEGEKRNTENYLATISTLRQIATTKLNQEAVVLSHQ